VAVVRSCAFRHFRCVMAAVCSDNVNCRSCRWTMLQFCHMCDKADDLVDFLVRHHVILPEWWCERCGAVCRRDFARFSFRCDKTQVSRDYRGRRKVSRCNYSRSFFVGTWFGQVRLSMDIVSLIVCGLLFPFLVKTRVRVRVRVLGCRGGN